MLLFKKGCCEHIIKVVGRSATAVKLKVSGHFKIFSNVNSQPLHFFDVCGQIGQGSSKFSQEFDQCNATIKNLVKTLTAHSQISPQLISA